MHEGRRAGGAEESANEVFACLALEMCTCSANRLHRLHFQSSSRMLAAEFVGTAGFSGSRRISQSATSFPSTTSAWRCFTIVENNLATFFSNCHTFSTMQHSIKKSDLVSRFEGVGKQFERQPSQNPFQSLMVFLGSCRPRACRQLRLVIFKVCLHLMREANRLQSHNFPQLLKETDYLN